MNSDFAGSHVSQSPKLLFTDNDHFNLNMLLFFSYKKGRGRGGDSQHPFKPIEEEGGRNSDASGSLNSKSGGPLPRKDGPYSKTPYSRAHNNWDDRETSGGSGGGPSGSNSTGPGATGVGGGKKEYSRAMNEENWRNKAAANAAENESNDNTKESGGPSENSDHKAAQGDRDRDTDTASSAEPNNTSRNWRTALDKPSSNQQTSANSRDWPSYKKNAMSSTSNNMNNNNSSSTRYIIIIICDLYFLFD